MAIKLLRITYLILLAITPVFAQDDYDQWLKEQDASLSGLAREETAALAAISKEFDNYAVEQDKLFQSFKDEVEKKWDSFRFSGKKVYVDYDDDLDARGSIDFEKGEVEIEVIVEQKDGDSRVDIEKVAKKKLEKKIETLVVKPAEDKKAILKDQVADKNGKKITEKNAKSFSKEVVRSKKPVKKPIKSKDNKKRVKYSVKFKLLPDHLKTRSNRYKNDVLSQAKRHNLPPSLVFAVIHTESNFNPKARSHIPAYGLMQLVPKSGARDAYRYIYKKDKLLRGGYLYNPENNIELGCAYLGKLKNVYFKGINDEESAYHCVISAYNTGPGNVAKAFTGTTKLKPTIKKVNTMSSKKVYSELRRKLPYKETQDYLSKVTNRMPYYSSYN
jgi:membrane-bound lytic murein transglycosylase C